MPEYQRNVAIMRTMCNDPKVTELVYVKRINSTQYAEIFPSQLGDMLSWLAGTQRIVVDFNQKLTGSDFALRELRTALYQTVEDLFPGGLKGFTQSFSPAELETEPKA